MTDDTIAVTGATGGIGGRVARRLARAGLTQRLVVRDPTRAPRLPGARPVRAAYDDPAAMRDALRGAHTLFLVSATERADRVDLHRRAVDAAVAAGTGRIVYLSFLGASPEATFTFARDHWHTEEHLRSTGLRFTILRNSLYQDLLPHFVGHDGVLRGPAGDGRAGVVARDDIADVAATVLRAAGRTGRGANEHDGRTYDVTGPAALTMTEVAEELTRATGREIRYRDETLDEAYRSRAHFGAPDWEVAGWVTSYAAIAAGELDVVADTVAGLAGHPPMSFAEFLATSPASVAHLQAHR